MSVSSVPHSSFKRKISQFLNKINEEVKKGKKEFTLYELSLMLDRNPHYIRYSVIPFLLELSDCYVFESNTLRYICEEAGEEK